MSAIFTSLIIAKNAKITFLQGNQLLIQKSNGEITAGVSGSEEGEKVRFWAGSQTPENAPFMVTEKGNARVSGEVNVGVLKYKTIQAKGETVAMDGYTLACGHGTYIMPSPMDFMQIYGVCMWFSRTAHIFRFKSNNDEMFATTDGTDVVYSSEINLEDNKLYKFTYIPDDSKGAVWFVSSEDVVKLS